jgi:thiamine kinase
MVTALPRPVQIKLEQTLAQWHQWRTDTPLTGKPEMQEVMGQGLSNYSVRVASEQQYVVRIDGITPAQHGLNRQIEWRALNNAHAAGLAPAPRYFNPELGSLVCDYLPPDDDQSHTTADLAELLLGIHGLPALHQRLDTAERINRYEHLVGQHNAEIWQDIRKVSTRIHSILTELSELQEPLVCCHNDLLRDNRIVSAGKLWAVDWEYCAMGSYWFDLAALCCGDGFDEKNTFELLCRYLRREPGQRDMQSFTANCCLYRYLEILWFAAQSAREEPDENYRDRANALYAALAARSL